MRICFLVFSTIFLAQLYSSAQFLKLPYQLRYVQQLSAADLWVVGEDTLLVYPRGFEFLWETPLWVYQLSSQTVINQWNVPNAFLCGALKEAGIWGGVFLDPHMRLIYREYDHRGTLRREMVLRDSASIPEDDDVPVALALSPSGWNCFILGRELYYWKETRAPVRLLEFSGENIVHVSPEEEQIIVLTEGRGYTHIFLLQDGNDVASALLPIGNPQQLFCQQNSIYVLHTFDTYAVLNRVDRHTLELNRSFFLPFPGCLTTVFPTDTGDFALAIAGIEELQNRSVFRIGSVAERTILWHAEVPLPDTKNYTVVSHLTLSDFSEPIFTTIAGNLMVGYNWNGESLFSVQLPDSLQLFCGQWKLFSIAGTWFAAANKSQKKFLLFRLSPRSIVQRIHLPTVGVSITIGIVAVFFVMLVNRMRRYYQILRTLYVLPAADVFILLDNKLRVIQMNHIATTLFQHLVDGAEVGSFFTANGVEQRIYQLVEEVRKQQVRKSEVLSFDLEDRGHREWLFTVTPLRGVFGRSRGYLVVGRDITEMSQHQRLVNWAQILHDIQTPLSTIRLNTELLLARKDVNQDTVLRRIYHQAIILQNRVKDILELSQVMNREREFFDLAEICQQVYEEYIDVVPENVSFDLDVQSCRIEGYPKILRRAIRNAVDNALKALEGKPGHIFLECWADAQYATVQIRDTGVGMDEQSLKTYLNPQYTKFKEGTGLGTFIIQTAIQLHNGTIDVVSNPGYGTTVRFRLPKKVSIQKRTIFYG